MARPSSSRFSFNVALGAGAAVLFAAGLLLVAQFDEPDGLASTSAPADATFAPAASQPGAGSAVANSAPGAGNAAARARSGPSGSDQRPLVDRVSAALKQPSRSARMRSLIELAESVSPTELGDLLRAAGSEAAPGEGELAEALILARWTEVDPQGAFAYASGLDGWQRFAALRGVLSQWAEQDPQTALEAVSTHLKDELLSGDGRNRRGGNMLLGTVAAAAARRDPGVALTWALGLESGEARGRVMQSIGASVAQNDPQTGAAQAVAMSAEGDRESMLQGALRRWSETDPEGAFAWASQWANDPAIGDVALRAAAGSWAQQDPERAAAHVDALPRGDGSEAAVAAVANAWAREDLKSATDWALAQGDPAIQQEAVQAITRSFDRRGGQEDFTAWADALPAPQKDQALAVRAGRLADRRPELSANLALGISDAQLREQRLGATLRRWVGDDRAAAERWLQDSGVDANTRTRLLKE